VHASLSAKEVFKARQPEVLVGLKLPSGKVVKSHLNKPKQEIPEVPEEVPEVPEEVQPDKPINVCCLMDNITHPDENTLLARRS